MTAGGVGAPSAATTERSLEDQIASHQREVCGSTGEPGAGCFQAAKTRCRISTRLIQ
jgi:hypothetical protein